MSSFKAKKHFPKPVRFNSVSRPTSTKDDSGIDVADGQTKSPPRTGLMARSVSTPNLSAKKVKSCTAAQERSPSSKLSLDFGISEPERNATADLLREHGCLQSAPWLSAFPTRSSSAERTSKSSQSYNHEKPSMVESALKSRQPLRDLIRNRDLDSALQTGSRPPSVKASTIDIPPFTSSFGDMFKTPMPGKSYLAKTPTSTTPDIQRRSEKEIQTPGELKSTGSLIPGRRLTPQTGGTGGRVSPDPVLNTIPENKVSPLLLTNQVADSAHKTQSRFESNLAEIWRRHTPTRESVLESKHTPSRDLPVSYKSPVEIASAKNNVSPGEQLGQSLPFIRSDSSGLGVEKAAVKQSASRLEPIFERRNPSVDNVTPTRQTHLPGEVAVPCHSGRHSGSKKSPIEAITRTEEKKSPLDPQLYQNNHNGVKQSPIPERIAAIAEPKASEPLQPRAGEHRQSFDPPKSFETAAPRLIETPTPKLVDAPAPPPEKRKCDGLFAMPAAPPPKPKHQELLFVNKKPFLVMSVLGRGGTSKVFQVFDQTSEQVLALKVVDLDAVDEATAQIFLNEVKLLEKLQGSASSRVIRLIDYEVDDDKGKLYILMEKGESDLAGFLRKKMKDGPLEPFTIKYYWQQMLQAVTMIHKKNIVHSDLKPANFLLVSGSLKLIDFGIATAIQPDMTSIVKDSNAGTYNYMSPEAIQVGGHYFDQNGLQKTGYKIGVKSDVWSLGCILYNLVYGRTPFQHITQAMPKLQAIINPQYQIPFGDCGDPLLLDTLQICLQRDPKRRPSIEELLKHPYLSGREPEKASRNVEAILMRDYLGRTMTVEIIKEISEKLSL